ncbi:MAG: hypothetical protein PF488_02850 [Patescibacteria group bacterium]|jgi:hypothetical protein|nr:hypothetical protein [Patescibacteria group bacterium]
MKNISLLLIALIFIFSSCENTMEDVKPKTDNDIVITMSNPGNELKSGTLDPEINYGDTIDIYNSRDLNFIFTAYNQAGNLADGYFNLSQVDSDLKIENHYLKSYLMDISNGPIASLKPEELGLYRIIFNQPLTGAQFTFYLRHSGLPGLIGDKQENAFAFRLDKKGHISYTESGTKIAYHLFLQVRDGEIEEIFKLSGLNEIKAILFHAQGKSEIEVKRCKYSDYITFSFFTEDYQTMSKNIYKLVFLVGEYGKGWYSFSSAYKSDWTEGRLPSAMLSFSDFN